MENTPPPVPPRPTRDSNKRGSESPYCPLTTYSGSPSNRTNHSDGCQLETIHQSENVCASASGAAESSAPNVTRPTLLSRPSHSRPHTVHGLLVGQSDIGATDASINAPSGANNVKHKQKGPSVPPRPASLHPTSESSPTTLFTTITSRSETAMSNAILSPTGEDSDSDVEDNNDEISSNTKQQLPSGSLTNMVSTVKMSKYEARLSTFAAWPLDHPQDPKTFAKYGMFYTGHADKTQCYSCGIVIWGWKSYKGLPKAPLIAHKKFYRNCGFLKSRSWADAASKLNLTGTMMEWEKADAPFMLLQQTRLDSFLSDSNLLSYLQSSDQAKCFAEAGFYRNAPPNAADTSVIRNPVIKCFYCGLHLLHGDFTKDPWILHAQMAPNCTYVKRKKGPLYVRKIQKKLEMDRLLEYGAVSSNTSTETDGGSTASALPGPSVIKKFVARKVLPRLNQLYKTQSAPSAVLIDTSDDLPSVRTVRASVPLASNSIPPPDAALQHAQPEVGIRTEPVAGTSNLVPVRSAPVIPTVSSSTSRVTEHDSNHDSHVEDFQTAKRHAITGVLKMGFATQQVEDALAEWDRTASHQHLTVERLVQIICESEERELPLTIDRSERPRTVNDATEQMHMISISPADPTYNTHTGDLLNFDPDPVPTVASVSKPKKRTEKNVNQRQISGDRVCIICMEEQSNYAFVPCGHVQTCLQCSVILERCPLCRHEIKDRIRIYL
ncbi:baculoviral IAP repeat-containing protein 2-like isoform X2 [Paramacrobiotus metropolitanus]|uniref:baculoviral IAP repeat-containing protein 2-like isoform X2 n=1 Tax=Paramacrobiotus metropolitanus TaxID=2943436 RepID=UPI00244596A7|nr:baculoviral IAP repeat-containing protein 2-like isoform X2 [Paramacrobiotus metropolitanus]